MFFFVIIFDQTSEERKNTSDWLAEGIGDRIEKKREIRLLSNDSVVIILKRFFLPFTLLNKRRRCSMKWQNKKRKSEHFFRLQ